MLARTPLFEGLAEAALRAMARQTREHTLEDGAFLPLQGRRTQALYVVVRGSIRLSLVSLGGREFVVAIVGRGEVLGELAQGGRPHPSLVAMAQEPTQALCVPWTALARGEDGAELLRRCNAMLAEREYWLLELLEDLALHPLDARLARLIARLHARSSLHAAMRPHRFSQSALAQMANASRPKVNQHLQVFQRMGAIELVEGAVLVRDGAALARIAGRRG
ncbi:Crp/Fnr family transcriptional regulator [Luteimonas sp. Y-2-2-4F]|nr:Crp/Fnr family transcriptional regulator [Luteimonas sp. Y-2-2-4F]MCD9031605.1 Crp/Fnr family transcriptional regulator [Luteimonas sp. Y-2-2-4F]MCD9031820.1 Crp/Fnr family transcriptional regulator [Luteimonas sp. Y-2-2-4F]